MTGRELARALGISETMVSKLRRRGMPTDSAERAARWRRRHLEPARMKGTRADTLPGPAIGRPPARSREPAAELALLILAGLAAATRDGAKLGPEHLAAVEHLAGLAAADARLHEAMRAALRAVPDHLRPEMVARLPDALVRCLAADALAAVADVLQPGAQMDEAEATDMGAILYAIAAGEIVADGNKWIVAPSAHHLFDGI